MRRSEVMWAYLFMLPWIIGLCVFIVGPILFSLGLSFFNYTLGREYSFIGLDNCVFLTGTGFQGPGWFADPVWAMPALGLVYVWGQVGGNMMVIFLAGLQGIPQELYEAASIDGATALRRFWHVTVPMISPTLFFNSILACILAFQLFEPAFIGTKGGPAYATWIFGLHIYRTTFEFFDMGYGSTLAWILFIALSVFTYLQFRSSRNWVFYAGEGR